MKNDLLAYRHIGISEKDEEKMLQKIGVKSLDELIDKTIPGECPGTWMASSSVWPKVMMSPSCR